MCAYLILCIAVAQDWKKHFEAEVAALSGKKEEAKPAVETKPAETADEKK